MTSQCANPGSVEKINRRELQAQFKNTRNSWPKPNLDVYPSELRAVIAGRVGAIEDYLASNDKVLEIRVRYSIDSSTLYRMIRNAVSLDEYGDPVGYRAAMPYYRESPYHRTKEISSEDTADAHGDAGAFQQLLEKYPDIRDWLDSLARVFKTRKEGGEAFSKHHRRLLDYCKRAGVTEDEYPLNRRWKGARALDGYLKSSKSKQEDIAPVNDSKLWGESAADYPLEVVQVDGHNMDVRITIEFRNLYGGVSTFQILRLWLIAIIDVFTRSILGYSLSFGRNYSHTDVLRAIFNALKPHVRPNGSNNSLVYRADGGFPNSDVKGADWATWVFLKLDNAMAHKSKHFIDVVESSLGCVCDYGPPHQPNDRALVESFFRYLCEKFSHRLRGTTGSNTLDKIRKELSPAQGKASLLLSYEELEMAADVVISDYNARAHSGIPGYSPISLFRDVMSRDSDLTSKLPEQLRDEFEFLKETVRVQVKGKGEGGAAYVNFMYVKYRNPEVLRRGSIDRYIWISFDHRDISKVKAYSEKGEEIGTLKPPHAWASTPHSLALRQEIVRQFRKEQFEFTLTDTLEENLKRLKSRTGVELKIPTTDQRALVIPLQRVDDSKLNERFLSEHVKPAKLNKVFFVR